MMLTGLAKLARRTGYPVVEVAGWKTRGRPGGMSDIRTITCHHTANGGAKGNYPSLRVVRDGRTGLPGPLAQLGIGVDGTIYVIAAGKSNHAGVSRSNDYTNSHAIGIEAEAEGVPGDREDWPPKQRESFVRLCRALVNEFPGVQIADVRGHKETCSPAGRKSDPSFSMPAFRTEVTACDLSNPPEELDDMSAAEVASIKAAIAAVPTTAEIVAALRPVIKAEAVAAANAAVAAWELQPIDLGPMASKALPQADRTPGVRYGAGKLLEWSAGHSAVTRKLVEEIAAALIPPVDPPTPQ